MRGEEKQVRLKPCSQLILNMRLEPAHQRLNQQVNFKFLLGVPQIEGCKGNLEDTSRLRGFQSEECLLLLQIRANHKTSVLKPAQL